MESISNEPYWMQTGESSPSLIHLKTQMARTPERVCGPFHFVPISPEAQRGSSKQSLRHWIREYNKWMNCQVKDELVNRLVALNNKLNLLSTHLVHGDEERAEVQQQRENLYAEIKHHKAKGHEGKPCPAARQV
jgi:hypothetical protein